MLLQKCSQGSSSFFLIFFFFFLFFSFIHSKPYDSKADVFAFGILVLELVTRRAVNLDRIGPRESQCPCGLDVAGLQKRLPKGIPGPLLKLGLVCAEWSGEKRPSMKQAEQMAGAIEKALAK